MRLKKLGAALAVVAALAAVFASSSFAAAATTAEPWVVGGSTLTGSETVTSAIDAGTTATFSTEVAGTKYKLESTGIECVGCKIENVGGSAVGSGKLKFTGVTVKEPASCSVASSIETTALSITADWMSGTTTYVKFVPTAGETKEFATAEITGCSLATNLVPKGSIFVQAKNTTGTPAVEQEVTSSEAINNAAGGSLKVGTKAAVLAGSAKFKLSGGKTFQVGETERLPNETATTTAEPWVVNGSTLTGSETVTSSAVGVTSFGWEFGGTKYVLNATGIECVGCKIENSGGSAVGSGKLKFTGVTMKEPAGCSVASSIETVALSITADWMSGTTTYVKFVPTAGETKEFATIEITGCSLGTTLIPKGSVFVKARNATATYESQQEVTSSEAINSAAGGSLKVGTKAAFLANSVRFKLGSEKAFGVL
jgi:hypothetical protein